MLGVGRPTLLSMVERGLRALAVQALVVGSFAVAMPATAQNCGVFEFTATGAKATKNVVVSLTSLLASEVEETGKCSSVVVYAAEDFETGCPADEACVMEFAEYDDLDMMITGAVQFDEDQARVKIRLLDASQGYFVEVLQRRVESDPAVLMDHVSEFAADLLRDQDSVAVEVAPTAPAYTEDELLGDLALIDSVDPVDVDAPGDDDDLMVVGNDQEQWDDVPIDQAIRPVEDGPIALEVSTLEDDDRPEPDREDLASSEDLPETSTLMGSGDRGRDLLFRIDPHLGIKAMGGVAIWQEPMGEFGLDFAIHVKPAAFIDIEAGTWIGTKHQPGSDDLWTYALIPFSIGFGAKGQKAPLVHPYVAGGFMGILYYVSPDTGLPQIALGGRVKGGVDIMFKQRFGVFFEGAFGGVHAGQITTLVDEDYWPGWILFSFRTGVIVQL